MVQSQVESKLDPMGVFCRWGNSDSLGLNSVGPEVWSNEGVCGNNINPSICKVQIYTGSYGRTILSAIRYFSRNACQHQNTLSVNFITIQKTVKVSYLFIIPVQHFLLFSFSARTLLVGWQVGHLACKNWVLICWWWHFDWSFARFIAPVVTINSITLSSNKILGGDILVPANPGPPGKWS